MIYISHNYSKTYERIKMFRINLVIFITLLLLSGCSSVINQPVDNTTSIQTIEQRQQQMQQRQTPQEKDVSTKLIKRVDTLEKKLDKLMKHLGVK